MVTTDQFYVRLFSTSSQEIYPDNTKSHFTIKLPEPLELKGEWECGLVEFFHDKIIGHKMEERSIILSQEEIEKEEFANTVRGQINPAIYTHDYFGKYNKKSYYDPTSGNSIWDDYNNQERSKDTFRTDDEMVTKVINAFDRQQDFYNEHINYDDTAIKLQKNVPYKSVRDLLHDYLSGFIDLYHKSVEKLHKTRILQYDVKFSEISRLHEAFEKTLFKKATAFIDQFNNYAIRTTPLGNNYVLIYTDIIKGHIVGNTIAKVLYMSDRKAEAEPLVVSNIQYLKVEKEYINELSIFIGNDHAEQLLFGESLPSKCTALVLHFRKIQ